MTREADNPMTGSDFDWMVSNHAVWGYKAPVKASVSGVSLLQLSPFFASIFPIFPRNAWYSGYPTGNVPSTACDVISFNGQVQLCLLTCAECRDILNQIRMSPIQSMRPDKKGNETACNVDSKIPMKIPLHYLKRLPTNAKSCFILSTLAFLEDCSGSQSRWLHVCRV